MTSILWFAAGVVTVVFLLVLIGQLGAVLLEKDPHSVWGHRFTVVGIATTRAVKLLATRNAFFRAVQESLPEIPAGVDATVRVKEGATLTVRAEEPASVAIRKVTPPRIPPLPLLLLVVAALLTGCTRADQVRAANVQHDVGHGTARTLGELCDFKAADAMPADDARVYTLSLRQRGCDVAWEAQTAFAKAHAAQVAAIEAAERGECMIGTPRAAPPCDLIGVATKTYTAGRALADSVAAVQGAVAAARAK